MPKKRKTRKEKILLDNKRQVVQEPAPSVVSSSKKQTPRTEQETEKIETFSLPTAMDKIHTAPEKAKQSIQSITISTNEYGYLATDLMKTALLTGAIVFAELLIRLFFVH